MAKLLALAAAALVLAVVPAAEGAQIADVSCLLEPEPWPSAPLPRACKDELLGSGVEAAPGAQPAAAVR